MFAGFFRLLFIFVAGIALTSEAFGVCSGCTGQCVIIPPTGSTFPCYQGSPSNTATCYNTDPLISPDSTWECGLCSYFGYPYYKQNDPVYTNMELWTVTNSSSVIEGKK